MEVLSLYRYVYNGPTNYMDPFGLQKETTEKPSSPAMSLRDTYDEIVKAVGKANLGAAEAEFPKAKWDKWSFSLDAAVLKEMGNSKAFATSFSVDNKIVGLSAWASQIKLANYNGTVIQRVFEKIEHYKNNAVADTDTTAFVEGFEIKNGVALAIDLHMTAGFFDTKKYDKVVVTTSFELGAGLYGGRGVQYYDKWLNFDLNKIKWLGPTKKYEYKFTYEKDKARLELPKD